VFYRTDPPADRVEKHTYIDDGKKTVHNIEYLVYNDKGKIVQEKPTKIDEIV
jgi:hypothetical protein